MKMNHIAKWKKNLKICYFLENKIWKSDMILIIHMNDMMNDCSIWLLT